MSKKDMSIFIGIHRLVSFLDKNTSNIAAEYKLTFSQFMVLEALYSKGNMTVGQVREAILSSVGTISLIIDNLVKKNYIERLADEKDRRVCILSLTEQGREIISQIAPRNKKMIEEYLSVLDEEEKNKMSIMLKKLGGRL